MKKIIGLFFAVAGLFLFCAGTFADMGATSTTVTAFWPTNGVVGADVLLVGNNLDQVSAVWFNQAGASFSINTNKEAAMTSAFQIPAGSGFIVATVPSQARSGPIYIATPAGTNPVPGTFTVYPPPPPVIYNCRPTNGVPGTTIIIFGDRFDATTAVQFNGVNSTFRVVDNTEITAVVPAQAVSGPIFIFTNGGRNPNGYWFTVDQANSQMPAGQKVVPH